MNFLAHLFLSGKEEEVMVGNFIGDFVKGSNFESFAPRIQHGIILHRAIDTFTDSHQVVLESKVRLRSEFSHYAPVIADIFYDHFLAKNWEAYAETPLREFTEWFYDMITAYSEILPPAVLRMLEFMKRDNWLYNYQFIEGIDKALSGLSRRTKFKSGMEHAAAALEKDYDDFENDFNRFFPDLQEFVTNFER